MALHIKFIVSAGIVSQSWVATESIKCHEIQLIQTYMPTRNEYQRDKIFNLMCMQDALDKYLY